MSYRFRTCSAVFFVIILLFRFFFFFSALFPSSLPRHVSWASGLRLRFYGTISQGKLIYLLFCYYYNSFCFYYHFRSKTFIEKKNNRIIIYVALDVYARVSFIISFHFIFSSSLRRFITLGEKMYFNLNCRHRVDDDNTIITKTRPISFTSEFFGKLVIFGQTEKKINFKYLYV